MNEEEDVLISDLGNDILLQAVEEIGPLDDMSLDPDYVMQTAEVFIKSEEVPHQEQAVEVETAVLKKEINSVTHRLVPVIRPLAPASIPQAPNQLLFICPFCDKSFRHNVQLKTHMRKLHDEDSSDPDQTVQRKFSLKDGKINDEQVPTKQFSCDFCDFRADRSSVIKGHIKRSHNLECDHCDAVFQSRDDLDMHTDISHTKRNVKSHSSKAVEKSHGKTSGAKSKKLKCDKCDFRTLKIKAMRWHFNREHQIKCGKCKKVFKTKQKLREHAAEPHDCDDGIVTVAAIEYDSETKMFCCSVCNHESNRRNNILRHIERIHKPKEPIRVMEKIHKSTKDKVPVEKSFKCIKQSCHEWYETQEKLERHLLLAHQMRLIDNDFIFMCTYCNYQNKQHSRIPYHIDKIHKNEGKSEVDKLLEDPNSNFAEIIRRLSVHNFGCTKRGCTRRLKTQTLLDEHYIKDHCLIVQDGAFVYMCPESGCGFSCRQNKELNQHLSLSHNRSDDKDESEWEDEEVFLDQTNGEEKLKRIKKVFRCRDCNFECRIQTMLDNHLFYSNHEFNQKPNRVKTSPMSHFTAAEIAQLDAVLHGLFDEFLPLECNECQLTFNTWVSMTRHEKKVHGQERSLTCDFCQRRFQSRNELVQHLCGAHYHRKPFQCNTCDYKSAYRRNLEIHVKKNHGAYGQNKTGSILKRAQRILHDLCNKFLPKECKDCVLRFPLFQDAMSHARDFHGREDLLNCSFCQKQFKTRPGLVQHIMGIHSKQKPFACSHSSCHFKSSSIVRFKAHVVNHKSGSVKKTPVATKNPTTTVEFFQALCDRVVPLVCNLCPDLTFTDYRKVQEHAKAEHKTDSLVCKICSKRLPGRPDLVQHLLGAHTGEKPFACDICPYTTSYIRMIDKHMAAHTRGGISMNKDNGILAELKDRYTPLKCDECNLKFSNIKIMLAHERSTHDGERALSCSYCNKKYRSRGDLCQHIAAHVGEAPFLCDHCDFSSSYLRRLIIHQDRYNHGTIEVKKESL